jgi:hypothetical protein
MLGSSITGQQFGCVIMSSIMNTLKAVFWDYPGLTVPADVKAFVESHKNRPRVHRWVLRRFLEHGRVVDTLSYFSVREIADALPGIKLSAYSRKKWRRIVEVYGHPQGR